MNKAELISEVAAKIDAPKTDVELTLDTILDTICEVLEKDEKVVLSGFGTFEVRTRAARVGRNPKTGEELTIPGQKAPAFKPSKVFKEGLK